MPCFACVRAPRDDAEPRESEKEIFYDAPSSFERRAPWWAPTLVKSSEVEERRLETDANATATATATTLATTQPKTHADDAFHRALARASSEMEAESRGGSFAAKARAYAKAVTAMASVAASVAARGGRVDLTSFLGTPIRWCARMSLLRTVTDSASSVSSDAPSRTVRFFEMLRRVDAERDDAVTRFAGVALAMIAEIEPPASLKKPLNPVLGETAIHSVVFPNERFESVWEQVSHHPPISAHCTRGSNVRVEGELRPKPHLVGAHIEVELEGEARITLIDRDETYVSDLPSFEWRFVPRWHSRMTRKRKWSIRCEKTGLRGEFTYAAKRGVRGVVYSTWSGAAVCEIDGRYDGSVVAKKISSGEAVARYDLEDAKRFRGQIVRHTHLDDERDTEVVWKETFKAMEENRWDDAKNAKKRVEESEREKRREREARGETFEPRFFTLDERLGRWVRDTRAQVVLY